MASGIFAWLGEALLSGATAQSLGHANPEGGSSELVAFLYDSVDDTPSSANLEDDTIKTLANLNTATGGGLADASHAADIGTRTVGDASGPAPYVLDAPDTVLTLAAIDANAQDVAIAVTASGGALATSDNVSLYMDVASPVTPNGQNITIVWAATGIVKYGSAV